MLILLFSFASCFAELTVDEVIPELRKLVPDKKPRTKYAYVSAYSGDDVDGHYFLLALVSGYNIKEFDPDKDRVLIIPNSNFITKEKLKLLKKVWTHIVVREYIKWPEGVYEKDPKDKHMWFKLNAWTLTGYKKIYWTGTDVLFLKDPSIIFNWPAPASSIDFHVWGVSRYGIVTNGDCFLLEPKKDDFNGLIIAGSNWTRNPTKNVTDPNFVGESWIGPYDNGLMIQYFRGGITVLPQWFQYELPGNNMSYFKNWWDLQLDDRIVSLHFPVGFKPWRRNLHEFTDAWTRKAIKACHSLGFNLDLKKFGLRKPTGTDLETIICEHCKKMAEMAAFSPIKLVQSLIAMVFLLA